MADPNQFEFRPAHQSEMKDYLRVVRYVFGEDPETEDSTDEHPMQPQWTTVALHKGKIVATSGGFPFVMRLNGVDVKVDGVSNVGTDPGYRRRGLVRRLITDRLRMSYENDRPAAVLYASFGAIYQRFGYGLASGLMECNFDPRYAQFQFGAPPIGCVQRVPRDLVPETCAPLYDQYIEHRSLVMHRNPEMWKFAFGKKAQCAVHYGADNQPDGYLTYKLKPFRRPSGPYGEMPGDPGTDQKLVIGDFVWNDINAFRGLWEFIRAHDLVGSATYEAPLDDPAWSMLLEPRVLRPVLREGIWMRVVNAKSLLESRQYDCPGSVKIEILGDMDCPWNVGTWHLQAEAGAREVRRVAGQGDVRVNPQSLASLISGFSSLSQLVRIGRAEIQDPRRLPALDALFKSRYAPHCLTEF